MKKIIYKLALLVVSLGSLSSCSWLDLAPIDYYGSESFWKDESQVDGAMIALHSDLRSYYTMLNLLGEFRGGTHKTGYNSLGLSINYSGPIKDNTLEESNPGITDWYGIYSLIMDVNLFITKVEEEIDFLTESDKNYYLGQAYGLRAYYYFWLYRTFGGVPIIDRVEILEGEVSAEALYTARASVKTTLDFIKSDINKSEEYFAGDFTQESTKAMWSLGASLTLKADIYLWSAKFENSDQTPEATDLQVAKDALTEVIGKYSLMDDYAEVYSEKGNDEVIMTMRFVEGEATNDRASWLSAPIYFIGIVADENGDLITTDVLNQNGTGGVFRHEYKRELFDIYDDEDLRRDITFFEFYNKKTDGDTNWNKEEQFLGMVVHKNIGVINDSDVRIYEGDLHLYRYAEVLLFMAEIENKMGGSPSPYINEVRKRAYGENWDEAKFGHVHSNFTQTEFDILRERDKEFVKEGKRWFDVIRMHSDESGEPMVFDAKANYLDSYTDTRYAILNKETKEHMIFWPIDIDALNDDPLLLQTPGYETTVAR